ncbi:unnamed protein product [Rotaria sp. Silwood2]|nr:unnamed protein product [Rotaria sp. Silwood2]CAF4398868.1 unnamed protein product [Rotaria sp. Silwood2]
MIDMFKTADLQNSQVEDIFTMTVSEMKNYQGHKYFIKLIDSYADFTFYYFIAYERILFPPDHLNLSKLKVFYFNDEIALLYFTTKLPFRRIFQEQITDPILVFEKHFNEISCKNYTADVYEYILKFFENLQHLSIIGLFPKSFPPLLLRNLLLTSTFYSSTL